ncbi:MAG: hypothetical protein LBV30_08995 [Propionibacteriaceae bacterium]|jgi:hypothetical protein|nr:hypothetical protein [Propionibacteriaceae bacterium]
MSIREPEINMGLFDWFSFGRDRDVAESAAPSTPKAPTPQEIAQALDLIDQRLIQANVNGAVLYRSQRITNRLRDTLPRMDSSGLTSADQYALIATATNYLPQTIGSYIRLPRDWADSRPVDAGRSSLLVLIDQLDLLAVSVDHIFDAVVAADAQALVIQGRFLHEKFAPGTNLWPQVAKAAPHPTSADGQTPSSSLDIA